MFYEIPLFQGTPYTLPFSPSSSALNKALDRKEEKSRMWHRVYRNLGPPLSNSGDRIRKGEMWLHSKGLSSTTKPKQHKTWPPSHIFPHEKNKDFFATRVHRTWPSLLTSKAAKCSNFPLHHVPQEIFTLSKKPKTPKFPSASSHKSTFSPNKK